MKKRFGAADWKAYIPWPVCEAHPEYNELYNKAWELAFAHIKNIDGLPQTPYMDEAFCDTQLWIWDSCFMALFCKYAREVFPGVETLNNFYEVLYNGKRLPCVIPTEAEPEWTHRIVGEPYEIKVHIADNPPLFAWAEYENALMSGDTDYIKELLYSGKVLQKHYDWIESLREPSSVEGVFCQTHLIAEEKGYRWEGGCSGMDNTPRGRRGERATESRPNNPDMLWLDAICQQALSAKCIAKLFALVGDAENKTEWQSRFAEKQDIINRYYWDEADGFYYDIDAVSNAPYKVMTIASYWTLTAGVASNGQAERLIAQLENPSTFGGNVPLVSLARNDPDFSPDGEYWRGSVWLPTAYAALKGLSNYGMHSQAHTASKKLLDHMSKTYLEHSPHTIWECYSPSEAKPAHNERCRNQYVRPDFCGWSALGPISMYIEHVLGFHTLDAFEKTVEWAKPNTFAGQIGIKNLRFGNIVTDIVAIGDKCTVKSNEPYTLVINGTKYPVFSGDNIFDL